MTVQYITSPLTNGPPRTQRTKVRHSLSLVRRKSAYRRTCKSLNLLGDNWLVREIPLPARVGLDVLTLPLFEQSKNAAFRQEARRCCRLFTVEVFGFCECKGRRQSVEGRKLLG